MQPLKNTQTQSLFTLTGPVAKPVFSSNASLSNKNVMRGSSAMPLQQMRNSQDSRANRFATRVVMNANQPNKFQSEQIAASQGISSTPISVAKSGPFRPEQPRSRSFQAK